MLQAGHNLAFKDSLSQPSCWSGTYLFPRLLERIRGQEVVLENAYLSKVLLKCVLKGEQKTLGRKLKFILYKKETLGGRLGVLTM